MGLDTADDRRNTLQRASLMWGESTALLLAVSLSAGCTLRPEASTPTATPAAPAESAAPAGSAGSEAPAGKAGHAESSKPVPTLNPLAGEVTATESADGRTFLQLTPLPEVQPGDIVRVKAAERIVATALITEAGPTSLTALVTGLSDRTRPVVTGDRATRLLPAELLPPPATVAAPAAGTHRPGGPEEAAIAAHAEHASADVVEPAPAATAHGDARAGGSQASGSQASGMSPAHAEAPAITAPAAVVPVAAAAEPVPPLAPEVRARLHAERAYFDLASRILRLPAAAPEVLELQEQVRAELAEVELVP